MKEKIGCSQPTFLPWNGYFDLIDSVDVFIFLDDAQFVRRSWHQRNKIIHNSKNIWITLPVVKKHQTTPINQTTIFEQSKDNKILKTIEHAYAGSKYFDIYFDEFKKKFNDSLKLCYLDKINIEIIKWFIYKIGIKTKLYNSSELNLANKERSLKLAEICQKFNCSNYLSFPGAKEYLKEDFLIFKERKINIYIQNYQTIEYTQRSKKFEGYISVLDLLFNEGPRSLSIIRNGRKKMEKISLD